jgi:hypothetical protein
LISVIGCITASVMSKISEKSQEWIGPGLVRRVDAWYKFYTEKKTSQRLNQNIDLTSQPRLNVTKRRIRRGKILICFFNCLHIKHLLAGSWKASQARSGTNRIVLFQVFFWLVPE